MENAIFFFSLRQQNRTYRYIVTDERKHNRISVRYKQ